MLWVAVNPDWFGVVLEDPEQMLIEFGFWS